MFEPLDGFVLPVFVEVNDQLRHTGIEQLHPAELTDVRRDHHGIHTFYAGADIHHLCNLAAKVGYAAMEQVHAVGGLIIITAFPETGECLVAQGLFLKACRMERILVAWIQHQVLYHLIVGEAEELLDDQGTDAYVHRGIRPRSAV
jgi:hypothetical protein